MNRAVKIDLNAPAEQKQKIITSIREYRATLRKLFSVSALAEIAGADIAGDNDNDIKIKPNNDKAREILNLSFDNYDKKCHLYQLRSFVLKEQNTTWKSFVWDAARREVASRWAAKDPEYSKATRGYLVTQGARYLAKFNHVGIGMPRLTARPKLLEHKLILGWDHDIGDVEFVIPPLDSARYYAWKCLRDAESGWKVGTIFLNEKDGKIFVQISFERPDIEKNIDKDRILNVEFTSNLSSFIAIYPDSGKGKADKLSFSDTLHWLDSLKTVQEKYMEARQGCGNKRHRWSNKLAWEAIQKCIYNLTARRENGCKYRNHLWTRRICDTAIKNNAGTIKLIDMPEKELFGHPWGMYQFRSFLEYKMAEMGGVIA